MENWKNGKMEKWKMKKELLIFSMTFSVEIVLNLVIMTQHEFLNTTDNS